MQDATKRMAERNVKLGRANAKPRHHWSRYYNDELMGIVRERYKEDFALCDEFE